MFLNSIFKEWKQRNSIQQLMNLSHFQANLQSKIIDRHIWHVSKSTMIESLVDSVSI